MPKERLPTSNKVGNLANLALPSCIRAWPALLFAVVVPQGPAPLSASAPTPSISASASNSAPALAEAPAPTAPESPAETGSEPTPASPAPLVGEGVEIDEIEAETFGDSGAKADPAAGLTLAGTAYGEFRLKPAPLLTDEAFPGDSIVQTRARFWFHIYAVVGENEGLVHDGERLEIVYRKLQAPGAYTRSGRKWIEAALRSVQADLRALAAWRASEAAAGRVGSDPGDPSLRSLAAVVPAHWDSAALSAAAERLRFQRGLKERYREGLRRSYRWLPSIESTLVAHGLPKRLQYLPHVESSFQPFAFSKVGAAGMWQFMKGTGKRYGLKANYLIDERRDPVKSTEAAARLLGDAYRLLGTWPLALTGYNHGPAGVRRAVNAVGSTDLERILRDYGGSRFGFASGNFFAEFLAASSIAMRADSLFPGHAKDTPHATVSLVLPKATGIATLLRQTGLDPLEFEALNLALRPAVFRGKSPLPKGTLIHVPADLEASRLTALRQGAPLPASAQATALASSAEIPLEQNPISQVATAAPMKRPRENTPPEPRPADRRADSKPTPRLAASAEKNALPGAAQDASSPRDVAVLRPSASGLAEALPSPTAKAEAAESLAATRAAMHDSLQAEAAKVAEGAASLSLLAAGAGDRVHPWDRFDPALYHLAYTQSKGRLDFESGPEETLSHYAEWSGLPIAAIRKANRMGRRAGLSLGRKVNLPLDSVEAEAFIRRREENYRAVEEDFYGSYHVAALEPRVVERGFSVWELAVDRELPYWLLQKHNPGRDLADLHPGDTVQVPVVETGLRRWGLTRYASPQEQVRAMAERLSQRAVVP